MAENLSNNDGAQNATDFYLQELVSIVLTEARKRRKIIYELIAGLVFLAIWGMYLAETWPDGPLPAWKVIFLSSLTLIPIAIFAGLSRMPCKRSREAVMDISHIDSPEAIQALFNIEMHMTDRVAAEVRRRTIINWLLGMNAEKAKDVPDPLRTRARKIVVDPSAKQIGQARSEKLRAWLHAMEFIGDAKAVPVVRKCANLKGKNSYITSVRNKAQYVLPLLEARLADEARMSSLLRPATEPGEHQLLRSAGNAHSTGDDLLRPVALDAGVSQ